MTKIQVEWISVKDRLPHEGERVIAIERSSTKCLYSGGEFLVHWGGGHKIIMRPTHWMILPELPGESK